MIKIWCWSLIPLVLLLLFAKFIIGIWIGKDISFDWKLSASIFAYVAIFNWNSIWGSFLNGVGKIRLQIILVIIVGIINIPLIITLVKVLKLGVFAVPLSNFACLILGAVIGYLQYKKITNQTASGIWNS